MEAGVEGLSPLVQDLALYLYTDNGLVTLTQPERLKRLFNVLMDLFDRVGLRTNMRKTMSKA